MVDAFLSRFGLKSLKVGSPVLSIIEAAAQSDLRSSQDIFDLLNAQALDRATGVALDRIGLDEDMVRQTASPASGAVTVKDTSFTKISSKIYQGQPAPIIGSSVIYVTDASLFPASGRLFIGRGTSNYEGPINYSSKTNNGTYWTINLSSNTRRFHNLGETVIVGQGGNRLIEAGAVVQTPQGNSSDAVRFTTLFAATIPDGETEVTGVQVIAQVPGTGSSVPAGAIQAFASPPFAGATVTNPLPFSNGLNAEDDQTFRERIKDTRQSRAKGTALAITTNVQGILAPDENKRLTSSSVVVRQDFPTTLYIDDGTGYEETSKGVAIETLADLAFGGEQYFQVSSERPVAKAYVITENVAPFVLAAGSRLAVRVGGTVYEHTFDPTAFRSIGNASGYELAAAINSDATLGFSAQTAESGTRVRLFSKTDANEDIEVIAPVSGVNANDALLFSAGRVDTMRLYKNDRLLSKDGKPAIVLSKAPSVWGTLVSGETLTVAVDGTAAVTYTFTDQDFVNAATGFTSVGLNSVAAWAKVFSAKIPGITAVEASGLIQLKSNLGNSSRSKISITGGTLVTPGQMFAAQTVAGADNDYTLDRNTGNIRLETPLAAGDSLSIGTANTRAFVESDELGTVTINAPGGKIWVSVDGSASLISTGINSATVFNTTVSRLGYWGNRIRITAGASVFTNVLPGDWMIAYDTGLNTAMRGNWRVTQSSSTWVEIERQAMLAGRRNFTATVLNDGKVLVAGGEIVNDDVGGTVTTPTCEIFDPATNTWSPTGSMTEARRFHAAVRIDSSGKVLVIGGQNTAAPGSTNAEIDAQYLRTCEIFDPVAGTWAPAASLPVGQQRRQMFAGRVVNPSELVVIAGGNQTSGGTTQQLNTTYRYDAGLNTWTAAAVMPTGRSNGVGIVITAGTKLLTAGGMTGASSTSSVNTTDLYDSATNTWSTPPAMGTARRSAAGVLLADGKVLVTGGYQNASTNALATAEVFDPAGPSWAATTGPMTTARAEHGATLLGDNKVLVAFGIDASTPTLTAETYNPGTGTFTATAAVKSVYQRVAGVAVTVAGDGLMIGGSESATAERYNSAGNTWSVPDEGAAQANFNLSQNGLVFVRSASQLQEMAIATAANATAKNFVDGLNTQLQGAKAKTFRTNTIRVNTNTYEIGGDIAAVAADAEGAKLLIPSGAAVENLSTHLASVQSGNKQAGTPEFHLPYVYYGESGTKFRSYDAEQAVKANSMIVGLRSYDDVYNSATPVYRHGQNLGFVSALESVTNYLTKDQAAVMRNSAREWISRDRFYAASSFALGPEDNVVVVADQDTATRRFNVPLYRRLVAVGANYGSQNTFKDGDNGGVTLATAFGLGYDFNDYAVYMRSRGLSFSADAARRILWRYTRVGPDGDTARVRFDYPIAADQPVSVRTQVNTGKYTDISVLLPSGALKTGYGLRNTTKVGIAGATGPGGLEIVSLGLGYSVSSATRQQRLRFKAQTVNFTAGQVLTGGTSGVTATISAVISDAGATGVLQITASTGAFLNNETITDGLGGSAQADGTQYYQVNLTLTLPTIGGGALMDITNHGFVAADNLYLNSGNVNFPSGVKTLTEVTATTVSYVEATTTEITQANIGTVSFDTIGEAAWTGAGPAPIAVGDLIRVETTSSLPAAVEGVTMRVSYFGNQVIQGYMEAYSGPITATPAWATVGDAASVKVFSLGAALTASAIAAAVASLAAAEDSTCPITALITGTGAGTINKSSYDELLVAGSWVSLTDGVNYVKTTTSPGSLAGDYQLTFKNSINADLVSNTDWANETVRLVPLTLKNLVSWMNTQTVTGLSTVCGVEAADQAQRLQISSLTPGSTGSVQVQGGTGNNGAAAVSGSGLLVTDADASTYAVVTVKKSDASGLFAGSWVKATNAAPAQKSIIVAGTTLTSWGTNGVMVFDDAAVTPLWTYANSAPLLSKTWQIEKQGNFICFSFDGQISGVSLPGGLAGVKEGDYVRIVTAATPTANAVAISGVNTGIYRVVRVNNSAVKGRAFWIENPNAVEERVECDVSFYTYDSIMPGDTISISTDLWNAGNKGVWTVETVGAIGGSGPQFVNSAAGKHTMKLVVSSRTPIAVSNPGALGSQSPLVTTAEGKATHRIKRIRAIAPNQADGTFVDIKFDTSLGYAQISSTLGSVISPLDKLAFADDLAQGIDGYRHNTGLIAEANRVAYGDPRDPATYPGVVAAGAKLNISGPLVKRIVVALNLRVRSSISSTDIADRVRSAVASVINKTGIGEPIAISDLINAAARVNGVVAVSMVSPAFNSENDLIAVQPYEKPLVLSLEQDVLVSFAGE